MINKVYWNEYYNFWDKFVKNWFESGADPKDEVSRLYKEIVTCERYDFNIDELPEPYQGDPRSGVDAVVLNLNPGMSQIGHYGAYKGKDLEATKFYRNIDVSDESVPSGWLIRRFRDEAKCSYRDYVSKLSCLNPELRGHEPEVCGVDWWQGNDKDKVGGRMEWIRQIYGKNQLCPSRVFAPEICPFHSKSFPTDDFQKLKSFINKRVIAPTVMAVIENNLPFAVAVGKSYANVLTALGAQMMKEWSYKSPIEGWPSTGFWKRTYQLYSINVPNCQSAYIIVTWAKEAYGLPAPETGENGFGRVEKQIYDFVTGCGSVECKLSAIAANLGEKEKLLKQRNPIAYEEEECFAFWSAFREWCQTNGKTWCRYAASRRGFYDPNHDSLNSNEDGYLFFTIGEQSGSVRNVGPLVTLGILCSSGEKQRKRLKLHEAVFAAAFVDDEFDSTDWESGRPEGNVKRILFIRKINYHDKNCWEKLFSRMACDYERLRSVLKKID